MSYDNVNQIVSIFLNGIVSALQNEDRVELRGFGTFCVKKRDQEKKRNPKTGDVVWIEARKIPFFKAGRQLKEFINSPYQELELDDDDFDVEVVEEVQDNVVFIKDTGAQIKLDDLSTTAQDNSQKDGKTEQKKRTKKSKKSKRTKESSQSKSKSNESLKSSVPRIKHIFGNNKKDG